MSEETTAEIDYTEQVAKSATIQPGLTLRTYTLVGTYETLEAIVKESKVAGTVSTRLGLPIEGVPTSMHCERLPGEKGRLTISTASPNEHPVWGLEMAEIQKPIRAWKADEDDPPDLEEIEAWEQIKSTNPAAYKDYKWNGSTAMTGNTLLLAKKIQKGIQYFPLFAPVITCTERLTSATTAGITIGPFGKQITSTAIVASDSTTHPFTSLASYIFIKTCDRLVGALDGTYTRTQTWTGAEAWDTDLYPSETSS